MAFTMPTFLGRFTNLFSSTSMTSVSGSGSSGLRRGFPERFVGPEGSENATIAAGCFWGVEHMFGKEFKGRGLYEVRSGYIGGTKDQPSYEDACSGRTGHAEAVQITYDPKQITYGQLLEYFYKMHDPTTKDSQGPDRGTQYRSAIFYHGPEQEKVARDITKKVDEQWWKGKVVTQILEGGPMHIGKLSDEEISKLPVNSRWYDAEEYHQKYLTRRPGGYECPSHFLRKFPPLS